MRVRQHGVPDGRPPFIVAVSCASHAKGEACADLPRNRALEATGGLRDLRVMTKIVIGNPCQSSDWVMNTLIVTRLMVSMRLRGRLRELGGGGVTSVAAAIDHRGSQPQEVTCAAHWFPVLRFSSPAVAVRMERPRLPTRKSKVLYRTIRPL